MREKARIKATLNILQNIWEKNQDLRFVQLLVMLEIIPNTPWTWFYTEDHDLFKLQSYIEPRDYLLWWTRWKNGNKELSYRVISKMSNAHIANIIEDYKQWMKISDNMINEFKKELAYREKNNIFITD